MELSQIERMALHRREVHRRREFADESPMRDSQVHQMPIDLGRIGWNDEREIPVVHMTAVMKSGHSDIGGHLDRKPDIRVDTTLVLIPVGVTEPNGRFVTGLEKENFKVYEDKVEQEISQFSSDDSPLSVGIVFDTSGSMGAKLQKSRQAVTQFMKTANPEDEFFLIQFNDRLT